MLRQQMYQSRSRRSQGRYGRPSSLWGAPPPRRSRFRAPPQRPPGMFGYPRMQRRSGVRVYGCCLPIPLVLVAAGSLGAAAYARGRR